MVQSEWRGIYARCCIRKKTAIQHLVFEVSAGVLENEAVGEYTTRYCIRRKCVIWKPMHEQPLFRMNPFITREGNGRAKTNAYIEGGSEDVGMDIFERGLCLPSDGYVLDREPVEFQVDGSETVVTVTKKNVAQKGTITVTKTGESFSSVMESKLPVLDKNGIAGDDATVYTPVYIVGNLSGAVYEVTAAEDIYTLDGTLRAKAGEVVAKASCGCYEKCIGALPFQRSQCAGSPGRNDGDRARHDSDGRKSHVCCNL